MSLRFFISGLTCYSEIEYYRVSVEKLQDFQNTLTGFVKTLKSKKLDQRLSIELKDPKDYKLEDVLEIATKLQGSKDASEDTRSCMRVIRKCFRVTAKHTTTLTDILKLVPNDSYGSVIVGGFTLILAVSTFQLAGSNEIGLIFTYIIGH